MMNNTRIGVALVGGYLLGRTKKAKMAIGLGMFLAGKKLNFDPRQLGSLLNDSQLLGGLNEQVRKELLETTKTAATSALTHRIGGFADSLHRRTLALDGKDEDSDDRDLGEADAYDDEPEDDTGRDEEPKDRRSTRPKTRSASGGTASSTRTRASDSGRKAASSGTRKAASGGSRAASSAGRSTSGARKTASGARKAATGTARKAANRGGGNG